MKRLRLLRRAHRACDRVLNLYEMARRRAARGDICGAGECKRIADRLARYALDDLAAAEPHLPRQHFDAPADLADAS